MQPALDSLAGVSAAVQENQSCRAGRRHAAPSLRKRGADQKLPNAEQASSAGRAPPPLRLCCEEAPASAAASCCVLPRLEKANKFHRALFEHLAAARAAGAKMRHARGHAADSQMHGMPKPRLRRQQRTFFGAWGPAATETLALPTPPKIIGKSECSMLWRSLTDELPARLRLLPRWRERPQPGVSETRSMSSTRPP